MVPASLLEGDYFRGATTGEVNTAIKVYAYADLKQGNNGWPVKGYRKIGKAIGMQDRTVAKAAELLAAAGLVALNQDRSGSAVQISIIHNPARSKFNPDAIARPAPERSGNKAHRYQATPSQERAALTSVEPGASNAEEVVREPRHPQATPGASHAPGPRSMRSEWLQPAVILPLLALLTPEKRCGACLGLLEAGPRSYEPVVEEFCSCPFELVG